MSVLQGLTSLPEVPQLQYTAALTLAAYADWLADSLNAGHTANVPDLLQSLMRGTISFTAGWVRVLHAEQVRMITKQSVCRVGI